jgi:hypothetical protein
MTYTKLKLAAGVTLGILLAAGTTTLVLSPVGLGILRTPQTIARQTRTTYAALSSYSDTGTVVWEGGGDHSQTVFTTRLARPSLYRIDWTQTGPNSTENGIVWSQGNGDFMARGAGGLEKTAEPDKMRDAKQALAMSAAASGRGVSVIPEAFFNPPGSDTLEIAASGRLPLTLERAEKVGGVDCFVLSSVLDASKLPGFGKLPADAGRLGSTTTTLWIGKRDHLIHQIRTATKGMTFTLPRQSDDNIRTILERQNKAATPEAIAAWRTQMEAAMNQARGATLVFTETHDHIAINPKLSAADFAR